ncbi:MAG: His-Xaa-Ser system radical SAM maturase HxsB [Bacilli bacterium]
MKLNYFNFKKIENKFLLTNDFGNFLLVSPDEFKEIMTGEVTSDSLLGQQLLEHNMAYEGTKLEYSSLMRHALHNIKGYVNTATSLHIFVVTTACNMKCVYCQANNGVTCATMNMSNEIAEKAVDIALQSPAIHLSFEFQGGEPLLNFGIIQHIVEYTENHKGEHNIMYNIVTNLSLITDDILDFFVKYNFGVSTSIDGPELIHNINRRYQDGTGTYNTVANSIQKVRSRGLHVGAIQTTTRASLKYPKEIVRAYKDLGFDNIFIRPLTPLGRAAICWDDIGYTADEFLTFYIEALDEIIKTNQAGYFLKENHAGIMLKKIFGDYVNYMELRSPCGAVIGQIAYYADGDIFTCDEGRMLHEMGDHSFRLGNVYTHKYSDLIGSNVCRTVCASSVLETSPTCCDCVYQPYCGSCPVVNYAQTGDLIAKSPRGFRCSIYAGILDRLFKFLLFGESRIVSILKTWCQ